MLETSCLCGAVRVAAPAPSFVNACNCTLCCKTGAEWAYFAPAEVTVTGETTRFTRTDKPGAGAEVHFCPVCGATTHFTLTATVIAEHGNTVLGVNVRLAEPSALAGVERRFPDGRAWPGHGEVSYLRPPERIGQP